MKTRISLMLLLMFGFASLAVAQHQGETGGIDKRSYRLGGIGAFSEVVGAGVKKLALSSPMTPEEMDALMDEARKIADRNGVKLHRETDFLVTDLFPASVTEGKHVLLIYLDPIKEEYMALKARKERLPANQAYEGKARLGNRQGDGPTLELFGREDRRHVGHAETIGERWQSKNERRKS